MIFFGYLLGVVDEMKWKAISSRMTRFYIGCVSLLKLNRSHGRVNHNQKMNVWLFNVCASICSMKCY